MKNKIIAGIAVLVVGVLLYVGKDHLGNLTGSVVSQMGTTEVTLQTNKGDIRLKLLSDEAPEMTKNFVTLAKEKKYDGTIFHRVIDGFMIQGGDYENANGTGGKSYLGKDLPDEFSKNLTHTRGVVSMANRGPNTNGSQFFIVQKDSKFLDGRHSIFAEVIEGMDTVDAIAKVKKGGNDKPLQDVIIEKVLFN